MDLDYRNTGNRRSRHKCQQNYARVQIPITRNIFDASLSEYSNGYNNPIKFDVTKETSYVRSEFSGS